MSAHSVKLIAVSTTQTDAAGQRDATKRAQPLAAHARRSMIIDAVIPLLIENGRQTTSKQIAEAAGIAEGTIFRAFGDKETLIEAAIARYLDPEPFRAALRSIDQNLPIQEKVREVVILMRERFGSIFQMLAAVGRPDGPRGGRSAAEFVEIIERLLEPELVSLNVPIDHVAQTIRLVSFASSFPPLRADFEMSDDELASIILYGVAGHPAVAPTSVSTGSVAPEEVPC